MTRLRCPDCNWVSQNRPPKMSKIRFYHQSLTVTESVRIAFQKCSKFGFFYLGVGINPGTAGLSFLTATK